MVRIRSKEHAIKISLWPSSTLPFNEVVELARHAEATGWDGLWYSDHFMPNDPDTSTPRPEAWTTLAGIGALVPRLRLGTLVSGNTYRHPAVLAKMAATLDHITGGRFTLGLGSGWRENEHRQYGIPFHTVRGRLERLDEACAVIKALFEESKANFQGRFYQLTNASLEPKPVQRLLPLLIGGGGEKRTLRTAEEIRETLAAYEAIGVEEFIVPDRNLGPPARKIETLDRFIRVAAGR